LSKARDRKKESFEFLKIIMKLINGLNTNIRWELQRKEKRKPKQRISMPESPQRRCSYTSSSKIFARTYTHIEEEEVSHQTNTKKCPGVLAPSQIYGGRIIFLRCQKVFNSTKSVKHLLIQESKGNLVIIVNKGSRL
jgi:hypothetical protein